MDVATKLYASAKEKNPNADYKDKFDRNRIRSTRVNFFEGSSETVQLHGKEKIRIDTLILIIDTLNEHLKNRLVAYQEIHDRFRFLSQLTTIDSDELTKKNAMNLKNSITKTLMHMSSNQSVLERSSLSRVVKGARRKKFSRKVQLKQASGRPKRNN
ncbi:unnamed protein product [Arctia plantaginis]|uniref:Uncharacterized protein n=1 Tax=Arctia plantaginis TaxID=874455 RepID=A0A8S0Z059_ARCPL|nr:unnamed protein product [Arctia plantaginis]